MALSSAIVDYEFRPLSHDLDQRWLMAFAASVGESRAEFLDTSRAEGILAHPLFPLAIEWPSYLLVVRELIGLGLSREVAMLGLPLDYDLSLHRSIRPGDTLAAIAKVIGVQPHPAGAVIVVEWTTANGAGALVARSTSRILLPGERIEGRATGVGLGRAGGTADPDAIIDLRDRAGGHAGSDVRRGRRRIGSAAAHVFTECSGIWNPVHTDRAVALETGRFELTMPPAAVLAMAVGGALQLANADPRCVRRIRARFGAVVPVPCSLEIEAEDHGPNVGFLPFGARVEGGPVAIERGLLDLDPAPIDPRVLEPVASRRTRTGMRWHRAKSSF